MPHGFSCHGKENPEGDKHDDVGNVKSLLLIVVEPSGKKHPIDMVIVWHRTARQNGKLEHAVDICYKSEQPYDAERKLKHKARRKLFMKSQTHGQPCNCGSRAGRRRQFESGWQIQAGVLYLKNNKF